MMTRMKGKRAYGSPLPSPGKPAGKRRCLSNATPHSTRGLDPAHTGEADAHHDPPSDNVPEAETRLRSAADLNCSTQDASSHDQSEHEADQPPGPGTSQALVLVDKSPIIKQEDVLIDTASAFVKGKAAGTLLFDWPACSQGVTEGICDLKTLKRFMTSDEINDDHKAMWVSLVQTIVHEPDQTSVLLHLQNLLSGNSTLSDGPISHPYVFRHGAITRQQWSVTGCILRYANDKSKWSAAHLLDLALWVGGPDAGVQAARAFKVFGVWNPSGEVEPAFSISPIKTCLSAEAILRKVWPSEPDEQEHIIARANHHQALANHRFVKFEDAHLYLLRQCIGQDLTLFAPLSRLSANLGDVNSRTISRAYFESTLAPLLVKHFDADVDLRLAYYAAVGCQGTSIVRSPVTRGILFDVPQPLSSPIDDTKRHQGKGKRGKNKSTRTVFYPDDHKDDSEPESEREDGFRPVPRIPGTQRVPRLPDTRQLPLTRNEGRRAWEDQEEEICLELMRQMVRAEGSDWYKCGQISQRLKTEHNIDRPAQSIRYRWRSEWRHRAEFMSRLSTGDTDDVGNTNRKKERRQQTHNFFEEEKEEGEEEQQEHEDDEDEENEKEEEEKEKGGNDSDSVAPASAIASRKSNDAWSPEEDAICIRLMEEVCTRTRYAAIACTEKRFEVVANRMKLEGGFERSAGAVKGQWNHRLREASKFEDRGERKRIAGLTTSALGQGTKHSTLAATSLGPILSSGTNSSSSPAKCTETSNLRSGRPSNARQITSRVTRTMSRDSKHEASNKRTTNSLYQQSRDISLGVLSRFSKAGDLQSNWERIVEHRRQNYMEDAASADNPPFSSEEVPNDNVTSAKPRDTRTLIQGTLDEAQVEVISKEIRRLRRFVQSQQDQA